jgi:hypothetical protein
MDLKVYDVRMWMDSSGLGHNVVLVRLGDS